MITSTIKGIKISGITAAVSNNWSSIASFRTAKNTETIDKFIKMTGVQGRYNANLKQTTSDFCFVAAKNLMLQKNVLAKEIGALIFISQTADYRLPATACVLHHRLNLSKECVAFDINLGCSGYVYGLNVLGSIMSNSDIKKALLLVGDTSAKEQYSDQNTKSENSFKMLFGDSGTATLLEKNENASRIESGYCTDGSGFKAIINPYSGWRNPRPYGGASQMDDIAVFNFTISEVPTMINEFMARNHTSPDDYECLIPHQANLYILKQMAKRAKFPIEKVLISIDKFGNTSSASIPITLVKEYGELSKEQEINALMCGFGIGLSWGIVAAKINIADIFPLMHTDEYFEDGY